jgi:cation diffusion facilitator CzcD-associated flavoprotein CzcO
VPLPDTPIDTITETGVRMKDETEYNLDLIILATGFDAVTGSVTQIDLTGINGTSLKEKWSGGISSYLGMTVTYEPLESAFEPLADLSRDFPNMFYLYGAFA